MCWQLCGYFYLIGGEFSTVICFIEAPALIHYVYSLSLYRIEIAPVQSGTQLLQASLLPSVPQPIGYLNIFLITNLVPYFILGPRKKSLRKQCVMAV